MRLLPIVCIVALTAPSSSAFGTDLAFAQNYLAGSKQIVSFSVDDPTSMTVIGPQTDTFVGMDFDPGANVLWAIDFTAQTIGSVNQVTGAYTSNAALQGGCCIKAFTIDPVGGKFYVSNGDAYIYELDATSGETTLVAQGAVTGAQIGALAIDCAGRMFALAAGVTADNLFQVHLDGPPTLVGSTGFAGATSLEFDNRSGVLYAWFNPPGNDTSTHAIVDTSTVQLSQSSQVAGKYRMAIRNVCSIFADDFEA